MTAKRYKPKPIQTAIDAIQYRGLNAREVMAFTEGNFRLHGKGNFNAEVFDVLHSTWISVKKGDYIIRGIKGEFYPCDEEVFLTKYEEA